MAPKTKEQFDAIRQRSIAKIKEAALELFGKNGYHNTSISQITRAAGVSKGLLYNYFDSKEELLQAIVEEALEETEQMVMQFTEQEKDPYQQLKIIVEGSMHMVASDPHHWKLMTALALQSDVVANLEGLIKRKTETGLDYMEDILRRLGVEDPRSEAHLIGAILDGIMLHFLTLQEVYPLEAMKEYLLTRYKKYQTNEKD